MMLNSLPITFNLKSKNDTESCFSPSINSSSGFLNSCVRKRTFKPPLEPNNWKGSMFSTLKSLKNENLLTYQFTRFTISDQDKKLIENFVNYESDLSNLMQITNSFKNDIYKLEKEIIILNKKVEEEKKEKKIKNLKNEISDLENKILTLKGKMNSNCKKEQESKKTYEEMKKSINDIKIIKTDHNVNSDTGILFPNPIAYYFFDKLEKVKDFKEQLEKLKFTLPKSLIPGSVKFYKSFPKYVNLMESNIDDVDDLDIDNTDFRDIFKSEKFIQEETWEKEFNIDKTYDEFSKEHYENLVKLKLKREENLWYHTNIVSTDCGGAITNDDISYTIDLNGYYFQNYLEPTKEVVVSDESKISVIIYNLIYSWLKNIQNTQIRAAYSVAKDFYYDFLKRKKKSRLICSDGYLFSSLWDYKLAELWNMPIGAIPEKLPEQKLKKSLGPSVGIVNRKTREEIINIAKTHVVDNQTYRYMNKNFEFFNSVESNQELSNSIISNVKTLGSLYSRARIPFKILKGDSHKDAKVKIVKMNLIARNVVFKRETSNDPIKEIKSNQISITDLINRYSDIFCLGFSEYNNSAEPCFVIDGKKMPRFFHNKYAKNLLASFKESGMDFIEHYKSFMMYTRLLEIINSLIATYKKKKKEKAFSGLSFYAQNLSSKLDIVNLTRINFKSSNTFKIDAFMSRVEFYSNGVQFGEPNEVTKLEMIKAILNKEVISNEASMIVSHIELNY